MSPPLTRVAVYRRTIAASLERVRENVHDWEHLPWLHRESFSSIDSGAWPSWMRYSRWSAKLEKKTAPSLTV